MLSFYHNDKKSSIRFIKPQLQYLVGQIIQIVPTHFVETNKNSKFFIKLQKHYRSTKENTSLAVLIFSEIHFLWSNHFLQWCKLLLRLVPIKKNPHHGSLLLVNKDSPHRYRTETWWMITYPTLRTCLKDTVLSSLYWYVCHLMCITILKKHQHHKILFSNTR